MFHRKAKIFIRHTESSSVEMIGLIITWNIGAFEAVRAGFELAKRRDDGARRVGVALDVEGREKGLLSTDVSRKIDRRGAGMFRNVKELKGDVISAL